MKEEAVITTNWPKSQLQKFKLEALLAAAKEAFVSGVWLLAGFGLLLACWGLVSAFSEGALPGPLKTLAVLWELVSHPFYDNGPNDKGVGIQMASSLVRVFAGFGLGSLVAIPAGLLIGASETCKKLFYPIVPRSSSSLSPRSGRRCSTRPLA
jgi:nitrate/nitrite transport system permease protein